MKRKKWYVGLTLRLNPCDRERQVFTSDVEPTTGTHGHRYLAVIGPFRTKRGARFMARYGQGNPHCRCVADAERMAKLKADGLL